MSKLKTPEEYIKEYNNRKYLDSEGYNNSVRELIKQVQCDTLDFAADNAEVINLESIDSDGQSIDYYIVDKDSILKHKP